MTALIQQLRKWVASSGKLTSDPRGGGKYCKKIKGIEARDFLSTISVSGFCRLRQAARAYGRKDAASCSLLMCMLCITTEEMVPAEARNSALPDDSLGCLRGQLLATSTGDSTEDTDLFLGRLFRFDIGCLVLNELSLGNKTGAAASSSLFGRSCICSGTPHAAQNQDGGVAGHQADSVYDDDRGKRGALCSYSGAGVCSLRTHHCGLPSGCQAYVQNVSLVAQRAMLSTAH